SIRKHRTDSTPCEASVRKGGIFRSGKERTCPPSRQAQDKFACRREGLRGGVHTRVFPFPAFRRKNLFFLFPGFSRRGSPPGGGWAGCRDPAWPPPKA